LHGNKQKFERLFEAAKGFGAEIVVNCGDMLPKTGDLFCQGDFITKYLVNHFEKFNNARIYYLCFLGNDDLKIFDKLFEDTCNKSQFIINLAQRKIKIKDYEFIGMNLVVDYPFRLKDRCRIDTEDYLFQGQFGTGLLSTPNGLQELEDWFSYARGLPTIEDELKLLEKPNDKAQSIYVMHMPPSKLGLDKCSNGLEVGSNAIYDFLLEIQPKLSLHGHIHESPESSGKWYAKLNNTVCIQPGQLSPFTYVTIDLQTMQFDRHKITL